ncbi:MAG TPA: LiaF domain-containing protein [Kofleriaceae bacterium]|jgi:hypothetical protein
MALFDNPIVSTIGGIEIDLASAPIAPGAHRLQIEATIGGIEIYVPEHVKFTIEGGAIIGGYDVHEGLPWWTRLGSSMLKLVGARTKIPQHAVPNFNPDELTTIHFVIEGGIGGIDVYRLPAASPDSHVC